MLTLDRNGAKLPSTSAIGGVFLKKSIVQTVAGSAGLIDEASAEEEEEVRIVRAATVFAPLLMTMSISVLRGNLAIVNAGSAAEIVVVLMRGAPEVGIVMVTSQSDPGKIGFTGLSVRWIQVPPVIATSVLIVENIFVLPT